MTRGWCAAALAAACATAAEAQDVALDAAPARWRASVERVDDEGEDLGLVGLHFDLLAPFDELPQVYLGPGGFLALTGDDGGFLAGGATLGWLEDLGAGWALDVGVFAGGGGGGDTDVGAGYLVRPHLAVEKALGLVALRLELARFEFPDGAVDGTHLALGASLPSELLTARRAPRPRRVPGGALLERMLRLGPRIVHLVPASGVLHEDGSEQEDLDLVGLGLDAFVARRLFVPARVLAAASGDSAGFALVQTGLGLAVPLGTERLLAEATALVGGAGGGEVDTGGGLVWELEGALTARIAHDLALRLGAGLLDAPDGELEATTIHAGFLWTPSVVDLALDYPRSRLVDEGLPASEVALDGVRLAALHKSVYPRGGAREKNGEDLDDLALVGVGIERPFGGDGLFVGARALVAYGGDAGGFGQGFGSFGWETHPVPERPEHVLALRLDAGVAGGGGVDVGPGRVFGGAVRYGYDVTERLGIEVEAGYEEADRGSYEADFFTLGLRYDLVRAVPR